MMQDYELSSNNEVTNMKSASKGVADKDATRMANTIERPSMKAVENILNFARCCQCVNVKDVKIKLFLN